MFWAEASTAAIILLPRQDRLFPGLAEMQAQFREPLLALARESGAIFVVGGLGVTDVPGERQARVHNSVFVLDPAEGIVDRYDKTVLVPFGEYVPLRAVFGSLGAVATSLADMADITPGAGERDRSRGFRVSARSGLRQASFVMNSSTRAWCDRPCAGARACSST